MRVLILCADPSVPLGGSRGGSAHLRAVASALLRAGHLVDCAVVSLGDRSELAKLQSRGLSLHALDSRGGRAPVDRLLASSRPDLVIERLAPFSPHGAESAAAAGIAHVYKVAALPGEEEVVTSRAANSEEPGLSLRRGFAASRGAVVASEDLASWVRSLAPDSFPITVIPNVADPSLFEAPSEAERSWAHSVTAAQLGEFVIGFMGSFRPWHDLETLVHAIAMFQSRFPARLLLIGDGPQRSALLALTHQHRIPTVFAGNVRDGEARALLECCDAVAMPYGRSGADFSPIRLVEAMAAGRPIVATETGPTRRVLAEGASGVLVPAGDPTAMARAFERLATQSTLRQHLAESARRRASHYYAWDVAVERVLAFAGARRMGAEHCA
jgi:glycosyltransferase involved in cell wall biosynthesis